MFFPDLSDYSYGIPRSLTDVLNIAWLDVKHPFKKGNVPATFDEHLKRCLVTASVNKIRGFHQCNLCSRTQRQAVVIQSQVVWLGAAEIWLPAPDGKVFAAPNLIVHYVGGPHDYLPPDEFIDVVMDPNRLRGWDAEEVYEARTAVAFKEEGCEHP